MGSLQQPNRFRPYTQTTQSGFPQSLSGSETDISTSNENLSNEEKYVIKHTARQEPQGQENQQASDRNSLKDSLASNRSSLDVSSSSYNTLIIHSAGDEPWTGRNSGGRESNDTTNSSNYVTTSTTTTTNLYHDNVAKLTQTQRRSSVSPSSSLRNSFDNNIVCTTSGGVHEITEIPDDYLSQSSVLKHLAKEVKVPSIIKAQDLTNFLANGGNILPPPPEYPKWADKSPLQAACQNHNISNGNNNKIETNGRTTLSKSQPDLSTIGIKSISSDFTGFRRGVSAPRPPTKGREENNELKTGKETWSSAEMVEILIKENSALKIELDNLYNRVAKTQRLEQEILKVHKAQEDLMQSCERRERLERAARGRLQSDNRRLAELNRAFREQIDLLSAQLLTRSPGPDSNTPDTYQKQKILIAQLIQQNKEHVAAKERQEIELAAQRVTLQEQRTHIDILDTALTNAQSNVVRLEEELRKKQVYVERVAQLQRALSSQQLANDRREQAERKLRLQLERELQRAKILQNGENCKTGWDSPNGSGTESPSELKRQLREKDEKIMRLEGECSKWEQRYLEESALRQAAIDAASIPKDAKIAALEKTSQETEKIIAEARNEKIRHMDEVHAAQKKVADLESRVKDLESKLAERDAMIKVLQKHTYDKDVSSMLGCSPHHTPHPSLGGTDIDHVLSNTVSREELVSSVLTSSTGFGSNNSYAGSDSSYMPSYTKYENKSFDSTKQTLDNQLKEIDSQLLSKRGLCCFPGFTNPVTAQRKGKIPKPLLASVVVTSNGGNKSPSTISSTSSTVVTTSSTTNGTTVVGGGLYEPSAMLLLEKQGRTSQQQRMHDINSDNNNNNNNSSNNNKNNSTNERCLAPSSLPRPPRPLSHRSGLPRRLGGVDYNRLINNNDNTNNNNNGRSGSETPTPPRKKSDGGDSLSSNTSSRRTSPARSLIPPSSRKFGEYGRLSDSGNSIIASSSSSSIRKQTIKTNRNGERDSASTLSDNSASSLPPPTTRTTPPPQLPPSPSSSTSSKIRLFNGSNSRRGGSLGRDSKSSTDSTKYRIQF